MQRTGLRRIAGSPVDGNRKFSAYLSIFNDWDILEAALGSIAPYVDELVVVDGAYRWMTPFLDGIGTNPVRSAAQVYDRLESSRIPYRVLQGVWENEWEKRKAGYSACRHRYRLRVDADEVYSFDEPRLRRFFEAEAAVGLARIPLYVAPGWVVADNPDTVPFLFDSTRVGASDHLSYLWLVDKTAPPASHLPTFFEEPVAVAAHLAHWRTPATSINRAAFYALNWIRQRGAPWYEDLAAAPLEDLGRLFERIPAHAFLDALRNTEIAIGHVDLSGRTLVPSPLCASDEGRIAGLFEGFLHGQAIENQQFVAAGRYTLSPIHIDLTSPSAQQAISSGNEAILKSSVGLTFAKARLHCLLACEPWQIVTDLHAAVDADRLRISLPDCGAGEPGFLRRWLIVWFGAAYGNPLVRFEPSL